MRVPIPTATGQASGQKPVEVFAAKGQARATLLIQVITAPGQVFFSKHRAQLETQDPGATPKGGWSLSDVTTKDLPFKLDNFNGKLWAKNGTAGNIDIEIEDISSPHGGGDEA